MAGLVRIAGVWLRPSAVTAVREGVLSGTTVHLSCGHKIWFRHKPATMVKRLRAVERPPFVEPCQVGWSPAKPAAKETA